MLALRQDAVYLIITPVRKVFRTCDNEQKHQRHSAVGGEKKTRNHTKFFSALAVKCASRLAISLAFSYLAFSEDTMRSQ